MAQALNPTCEWCGLQHHSLVTFQLNNKRGYWHPVCFEANREYVKLAGSANYTNSDAFDESVFRSAAHFRLHRFTADGRADTTVPTFTEAMVLADDELKAGHRVLVYAVSPEGRYFCMPPKLWGRYAAITLAQRRRPQ